MNKPENVRRIHDRDQRHEIIREIAGDIAVYLASLKREGMRSRDALELASSFTTTLAFERGLITIRTTEE